MFDDINTAAAVRVYHAYKMNVENLGGHYDKDIIFDQKHWLKTAKLALANSMEPARFVNAQFLVLDDERRHGLTPRMLYTPVARALSAYMATAPSPCDYAKVFDSLVYTVECLARRRNTDVMTIMQDPEQMLPPWFRILYSPALTKELSDDYLEAALSEAADDIHLQQFLKNEDKYGRFSDPDNKR